MGVWPCSRKYLTVGLGDEKPSTTSSSGLSCFKLVARDAIPQHPACLQPCLSTQDDCHPSRTRNPNKLFYKMALVMVFCHSHRKVTNAGLLNVWAVCLLSTSHTQTTWLLHCLRSEERRGESSYQNILLGQGCVA